MKKPSEIEAKVKISKLIGDVESLKEIKAKKNGEITINEILRFLLNESLNNEIEELAVVTINAKGNLSVMWTTNDLVKGVGMVEVLKGNMLGIE